MQTFLPYKSFSESAACLDMRRLGKQRVEAKQILMALTGESKGWINHPCTKMWRGYEKDLAIYGWFMCDEWLFRGYKDTLLPYFENKCLGDFPYWTISNSTKAPWLTDEFCLAHRSNLIRKMPEHYGPMWPDVPDNLPYVWPVPTSKVYNREYFLGMMSV